MLGYFLHIFGIVTSQMVYRLCDSNWEQSLSVGLDFEDLFDANQNIKSRLRWSDCHNLLKYAYWIFIVDNDYMTSLWILKMFNLKKFVTNAD